MRLRLLMFSAGLMLLGASNVASATLRGRVIESSGAPLPGVSVQIRGEGPASWSATTDPNGHYSIAVPSGTYDLHFRLFHFAGERRLNVRVEGERSLDDVTMMLAVDADIVVTGPATFASMIGVESVGPTMFGSSPSASAGIISRTEIDSRPTLRPGDVLETVPGLIVSQHSGEGKANQFYLRGFNLDHGTDFSIRIAGVPVNLPTHGHGQGYADTNFLIPELISGVQYRKGPYYASDGDFSSAGSADIAYLNTLDRPLARVDLGEHGYRRALIARSSRAGKGILLYAGEVFLNDGPWIHPEGMERLNGLIRYSVSGARTRLHITGMAYESSWTAADQIPKRAILDGTLSRFGSIDTSDGGRTHRYSLSAGYETGTETRLTRGAVWGLDYELDLFSNFTYFLDDPINGDQFEQVDDRNAFGAELEHRVLSRFAGLPVESRIGVELRHDRIHEVGLYRTRKRERHDKVRTDSIRQWGSAAYLQTAITLSRTVRIDAGLRADFYRGDVAAEDQLNSGDFDANLVSPKLGLVFGPWNGTELYLNAGYGMHSNDARGVVSRKDPMTGESMTPADPLVRTRGAEAGIRSSSIGKLDFTSALWLLDIDSELLFVGDAGTTEATRPSRRQGVELDASYSLMEGLIADLDLAWTRARFTDGDPAGSFIPGSPETVGSIGLLYATDRWSTHIRHRYFGPRPLDESGELESRSSDLTDLKISFPVAARFTVELNIFNLFGREVSDIDYFYTSRLPHEPAAGVDDIHLHPALPRTFRLGLRVAF